MEQNPKNKRSKTCRTCLVEISDTSQGYYLYSDQLSPTREKLKELVPDMNLFLTPSPVICGSCYVTIESAYNFKMKCLEIEKFIHIFIEKHSGSVVDLMEVNRHNSKSIENCTDNDSENYQSSEVCYVNVIDKPVTFDTYKNDSFYEPQHTEFYEVQHYGETHHEFVDINHLVVKNDSTKFEDKHPNSNVIIVDSSSDEDDDNTFDFYKKTPYSCNECPYRTGYKQNLVTHMEGHAQEESLQKNNELECQIVLDKSLIK